MEVTVDGPQSVGNPMILCRAALALADVCPPNRGLIERLRPNDPVHALTLRMTFHARLNRTLRVSR